MADVFTKEKRSEVMGRIRGRDTSIEIKFRKALWKEGVRYRKNSPKYRGKPDLVFRKHKIVVFLDSCFWHGCPDHFISPKSNQKYWKPKIERNKERDREITSHYQGKGWVCLRFWAHEIKEQNGINSAIKKVIRSIRY